MKLEYIKTFLKVVEEGSILHAAKSLNLSTSTVSLHINSVEKFFGVRLLERGKIGVKLTEDGKRILPELRRIVERIEKLREDLKKRKKIPVRIALGNIPGILILPKILREFKREYPEIEFSIYIKNSSKCGILLDRHEVNIAIACFLENELKNDYKIVELFKDRLILAVHKKHPLSKYDCVKLKHVLKYPLILPSQSSGIFKYLKKEFTKLGIDLYKINYVEVSNVFSQIHAVINNLGVAITSELLAKLSLIHI